MSERVDVVVVGAGLVGLATARALAARGLDVSVVEAEDRVAAHQSGHNSGVIHAGLYYAPGSLKARLCREGRAELLELASGRALPHRVPGKLVVAAGPEDLPRLRALHERGVANGLTGLEWLPGDALREREPLVAGVAALHVPESGIIDYRTVARALADGLAADGVDVALGAGLTRVEGDGDGLRVHAGDRVVRARRLVACAGLQADRVARHCGVEPGAAIVPFRGEYRRLGPRLAAGVRHLLYPVPDPALPFLGVHVTPTVDGRVELGPSAVLAAHRHGYRPGDVRLSDVAATLAWPGSWRLFAARARTGAGQWLAARRVASFVDSARRLLPDLRPSDLGERSAGVRAQALDRRGRLLDDFALVAGERSLHVINAPSPAATACLAIGRHVAGRALHALRL